jgi:hypothetical protein
LIKTFGNLIRRSNSVDDLPAGPTSGKKLSQPKMNMIFGSKNDQKDP